MSKFLDWFDKKLTVSRYPYKQNQFFDPHKFDVVINVSDEFYWDVNKKLTDAGVKTFWFPVNECQRDNGCNSIYGAACILWRAERNNWNVYLHCHAGVHRSPLVSECYYFIRTGKHIKYPKKTEYNRLRMDCKHGYLPPLSEMEAFLTRLGMMLKKHDGELKAGSLDDLKIRAFRKLV